MLVSVGPNRAPTRTSQQTTRSEQARKRAPRVSNCCGVGGSGDNAAAYDDDAGEEEVDHKHIVCYAGHRLWFVSLLAGR